MVALNFKSLQGFARREHLSFTMFLEDRLIHAVGPPVSRSDCVRSEASEHVQIKR
jgi:hypothetical protein